MPLQPRRTNTFSKKRITDTAGTVKGGPGWDRWDIWRKHFNIFQQYSRRQCVDMSCTRCKTGSQNLPKTRLTIQLRMVSACLSMSQQYPKLVVAVRLLLSMPSQSPVTRTYCSMAYMRTAPRGPKLSQVMQVPLWNHFQVATMNRMNRTLPQLDCELRHCGNDGNVAGGWIMGNTINWPCCSSGGFRCRVWCSWGRAQGSGDHGVIAEFSKVSGQLSKHVKTNCQIATLVASS